MPVEKWQNGSICPSRLPGHLRIVPSVGQKTSRPLPARWERRLVAQSCLKFPCRKCANGDRKEEALSVCLVNQLSLSKRVGKARACGVLFALG